MQFSKVNWVGVAVAAVDIIITITLHIFVYQCVDGDPKTMCNVIWNYLQQLTFFNVGKFLRCHIFFGMAKRWEWEKRGTEREIEIEMGVVCLCVCSCVYEMRCGMDPKGNANSIIQFPHHNNTKLIKVYRIIVVVKTVRAESSFQIKIN